MTFIAWYIHNVRRHNLSSNLHSSVTGSRIGYYFSVARTAGCGLAQPLLWINWMNCLSRFPVFWRRLRSSIIYMYLYHVMLWYLSRRVSSYINQTGTHVWVLANVRVDVHGNCKHSSSPNGLRGPTSPQAGLLFFLKCKTLQAC